MQFARTLAAIGVLSASLAAHADTVFNVNGAIAGGTLSGTITLNSAQTAFDGIDLTATPAGQNYAFTNITDGGFSNEMDYTISSDSSNDPGVFLVLDIADSAGTLAGFNGAALCSGAKPCGQMNTAAITGIADTTTQQLYQLDSGSVTAVTPEPASFVLLGTGLLGLAGAVRRRFV